MYSLKACFTALCLASLGMAHMELVSPPPFLSKHNPHLVGEPDYSMTSPLVSSGTYPCKGYIGRPGTNEPVAEWAAGTPQSYNLGGTVFHNGGSCQLVLSFDNGNSWQVIHSKIGGCVVESLSETFTLPAETPSGDAIFAWNWFNNLGNREMYQNCARVTITNGGSGLNPTDYPAPFVANAGVNQCSTVEGHDVVFPNPGKNVRYGGVYGPNGDGATPGLWVTGDGCGAAAGGEPAPAAPVAPAPAQSSAATPAQSSAAVPAPAQSSAYEGAPIASPAPVASSAAAAPAPSSSAIGGNVHASTPKCPRRQRKRSYAKRHERFIPRAELEHLETQVLLERRGNGTGRVAALRAEHNVHRV